MCSCSIFWVTCSFSSFPPSLPPWLLSNFFGPEGKVCVCVRGGVESRTHEILKSFLGSPYHQHMLLSSLLHSLIFFFSCCFCCYSSHSWCQRSFRTHSDSSVSHSYIHLFIQLDKQKWVTHLKKLYSNRVFCLHEWPYSPEIYLAPLGFWLTQQYHPLTGKVYMHVFYICC